MLRRRLRGWHFSVLALAVVGFLTLYPTVFLLLTSFKDNNQFYQNFWGLPFPAHLDNYQLAWSAISPFLFNSVIYALAATLGTLAVSCLAAYAFARYAFPGRELLYYLVIILLMVPAILTLVPSFLLVKSLGLMDTRWALILPYIAIGQVLSIYILRQFFAGLPEQVFEAARIDGASEFTIFGRIGLPLVRPTLVTIAILQVLMVWNDYLWPFVVIQSPSLQTLVVGLVSFQGRFYTNWGPLMAGYVLASLPLVVLFSMGMRAFIRGITQRSVRM
jgi:multiple sugar transport system permease protein/raffinose/stachyose/melibiose transport system permease protein